VPKLELGPLGAVLGPDEAAGSPAAMAELEDLGYSTIWLTGGPLATLDPIAAVIRATRKIPVAGSIIAVDRIDAASVARAYAAVEPGRFVVGLGGAHGSKPFDTLNHYLDELDGSGVPASSRVLAALGPRMLRLAHDRAAGALPVLITPDYTAQARATLGPDTALVSQLLVVLETDPRRARGIAREPLSFLGQVPAYQANFRRMGFTDDDISQLTDRLVDALVVWGDADTIAGHVAAHRAAGADQVALNLLGSPGTIPLDQWRELATALIR